MWFSQTPKLLINWGLPPFLRFPCSPSLVALAAAFLAFFRQRTALQLEILALRHQLGVLQRSVKRPKLTAADRFLWAWLAAVWTDWQPSSIIIKPATVIGWHRKGFRLFWTWKIQRGKPGRPAVPADVRSLIRAMSRDNPLWGAPRIHGELLKLGIAVGEIGEGHTGTSPRPIGGHGAGYLRCRKSAACIIVTSAAPRNDSFCEILSARL